MSICLTTILKIIRTNQQQFNKMANPYTQGLRYNYKPLDLSTIGKAAVMNQGQYDQTQSALDEFDVSINALSQQEDWARGEESKYREKIDALSDGLAQSKDPRASMRQLAKLNKEYRRRTGPGGDIGIVEGNVATMQDYRKRHQDMIAKGKNVPANFNTFLSMQMEGFKGFDDEGKLQSLGLQDMTANKSKEMTDRAIELAKMTKADQKMELGKYASIGGFRKEAIDLKLEELTNDEKAVYIQQVLANSAEFKPYLDQERSLIEYRNKGFDGETYMGNQLGTLDQNKAALEAQLAGKGLKENQKANIQNNLNAIEQKRKELSQGIDKYGAMQYGQMLKSNAEYHNLTALPAGTANLMNYKKETLTRSGYTDQAGLASFKSSLRMKEHKEQNRVDIVGELGKSIVSNVDWTSSQWDGAISDAKKKGDPVLAARLTNQKNKINTDHYDKNKDKYAELAKLAGIPVEEFAKLPGSLTSVNDLENALVADNVGDVEGTVSASSGGATASSGFSGSNSITKYNESKGQWEIYKQSSAGWGANEKLTGTVKKGSALETKLNKTKSIDRNYYNTEVATLSKSRKKQFAEGLTYTTRESTLYGNEAAMKKVTATGKRLLSPSNYKVVNVVEGTTATDLSGQDQSTLLNEITSGDAQFQALSSSDYAPDVMKWYDKKTNKTYFVEPLSNQEETGTRISSSYNAMLNEIGASGDAGERLANESRNDFNYSEVVALPSSMAKDRGYITNQVTEIRNIVNSNVADIAGSGGIPYKYDPSKSILANKNVYLTQGSDGEIKVMSHEGNMENVPLTYTNQKGESTPFIPRKGSSKSEVLDALTAMDIYNQRPVKQ